MPILELTLSGGAKLSVHNFSVQEALSELFHVSVVARAQRPDLDLEAIVGKPASLHIVAGWTYVKDQGTRTWKGVCSYIEQSQAQTEETGLSTYYLHIVPDLWLLTQRTNHRIFQHLSIPDIADVLLREWGVEPTWQIDRGLYPKLEFKVQYGESDYTFLCRLLEEAGITFWFSDQGGAGSVLTFGDKLHAAAPRPPILFVDNPNQAAQREFLSLVRLGHEVRPGAHVMRDHDFRKPSFPLLGNAVPPATGPESKYEQYTYNPGAFLVEGTMGGGGTPVADDQAIARHDPKYGTDLATRRLQSLRADKRRVTFNTNTLDLFPGAVFTIEDHLHPSLGPSQRLLVSSFSVEGTPGDEWTLTGAAVFADPAATYRPPIKTPRPRVFGVQSATVVGPPGKEIHTDEFGRVRVQFPWDRDGQNDDRSSCWMRVSQGWAGTAYGMITIPRVGQEVLVTFLDGDPDRPVVTGRVYNAIEQVPYKLPDDMTVSTWKSQSSPATGGYNEIKFDDKAGSERVYVQAERDLHKLVKNDEVLRTQHNKMETVDGTSDLVVKGARKQLIESADHLHVKLDQRSQVDGGVSLTVKMGKQEKVGTDYALDAGQEIHLKAGMTLVLEAGLRLTIKGPAGFIDFHPMGIDIVGLLVNINSGGFPGFGKGASPDAPEDATEAEPRDRPPGAPAGNSSTGTGGTSGQGGS